MRLAERLRAPHHQPEWRFQTTPNARDAFNGAVAVPGGTVLLPGLVSARLSSSPLPPSLPALLAGVGIGPPALHLFDLHSLGGKWTLLGKRSVPEG